MLSIFQLRGDLKRRKKTTVAAYGAAVWRPVAMHRRPSGGV